MHDFVPNYLMLELIGNHDSLLDDVLVRRCNDLNECNIVVKGNYLNRSNYKFINSRLSKIPDTLKNNMYLSKDFPIPGDSYNDFKNRFIYFINLVFLIKKNLNYLAQSRGTLVAAIIMGIKLGFKDIVLCGVDLSNSRNFYMSDYDYYIQKGYPLPSLHDHNLKFSYNQSLQTDRKIDKTIRISDSIKVMESFFRHKLDIRIYVGSKESILFPNIPLFKWN